jgi:hypothetical protein
MADLAEGLSLSQMRCWVKLSLAHLSKGMRGPESGDVEAFVGLKEDLGLPLEERGACLAANAMTSWLA